MNLLRRYATPLLALSLVLLLVGLAEACPSCKNSLEGNDPHHQGMVRGYFYSILFMMAMPFVIVTSLSGYMYLQVRRARAEKAQAERNGDQEL